MHPYPSQLQSKRFGAGISKRFKNSLLLATILAPLASFGQVNVTTYHNDNLRTGQNTQETILTPANVNSGSFGKKWSASVDGQVYGQPLYVSNVNIPGQGTHNVVYVVTENDSVYALDAHGGFLWTASLLDTAHGALSGATAVDSKNDIGCGDLTPKVGITSTPVIDPSSGTMYVETKSKEPTFAPAGHRFVHRLHALDITTGNEKSFSPIEIVGSVPGTGEGSINGMLSFNPKQQFNRPGLLLSNGILYVAFGSHCDFIPYHGWIFAYSPDFSKKVVWSTTPNATSTSIPEGAGIWMSGAGVAADSGGNIYFATGNGKFTGTSLGFPTDGSYGDSIVKMRIFFSPAVGGVNDYFTPWNQDSLNSTDADVGSGGVLLLPDQPGSTPHLLTQAGKEGKIYLINRDQMTANNRHYCDTCINFQLQHADINIVQEIPNAVGGMWSMPAYWNNTLYFWGTNDQLKSFALTNGKLSTSPTRSTEFYGDKGSTPSISSNGGTNGIVWSVGVDKNSGVYVLEAHDAVSLKLLYSSGVPANSNSPGGVIKFAVPTIANGMVYVGGSSANGGGSISAYGELF